MKQKIILLTPFLFLFFLTAFCEKKLEEKEVPEIYIPICESPPEIDGELNDECWKNDGGIKRFHIVGSGKTVDKHRAWICRDDKWLYVGFDVSFPAAEDRQPAKYFRHDDNVQREDNVQLSFDPGTDGSLYYQFLLNKANTRADFRMTAEKGRERENWNIPWRSAVKVTEKGWSAEIALPFSLLTIHGNLAKAKLNLLIASYFIVRDAQHCVIDRKWELCSWVPLNSHFHEPDNFGKIKNLNSTKFKAPFLPFITGGELGAYYRRDGKFHYDLKVSLKNLSGKEGKVKVVAIDKPLNGESGKKITVSEKLSPGVKCAVKVSVPVNELSMRDAEVYLVDPVSGEKLQRVIVKGGKFTELFSCYLDRNYYTTENKAIAVCAINLPSKSLSEMKVIIEGPDGKSLSKHFHLKMENQLSFPILKLNVGENIVKLLLINLNGEKIFSQKVKLLKRKPKPGCEWKIDRINRVLLKNGKPHFFYGVLLSVPHQNEKYFKFVSELGFNTIVQWNKAKNIDSTPGEYLETAAKYGLDVMANPDEYSRPYKIKAERKLLTDENLEKFNQRFMRGCGSLAITMKGAMLAQPFSGLTNAQKSIFFMQHYLNNESDYLKVVKNSMNHPNLMGYFILDEPLPFEFETGKVFYKAINKTDGYHPVIVNFNSSIPDVPHATDWYDIVGMDPYWSPDGANNNSPNRIANNLAIMMRRTAVQRLPVWTVLIAEYYSGSTKRFISPQEQRAQTYLALINGAKGIGYYQFPLLTKKIGDTFRELAEQIKILGPACVLPSPPIVTRYSQPHIPLQWKFADVQACVKKRPDGGMLIICANSRDYSAKVNFSSSCLKGVKEIKRMFATDTYPVLRETFSDILKPYAVRVYVFKKQEEIKPCELKLDIKPVKMKFKDKTKVWGRDGRSGYKNLIANPGFEQTTIKGMPDYHKTIHHGSLLAQTEDLIGGVNGRWGVVDKNPFEGKNCLRLYNKEDEQNFSYSTVRMSNPKKEKYVYSAYMRAESEGDKAYLRINRGEVHKEFILTKDWKRYSVVFTPGSGYNMIAVVLPFKTRPGTIVYVDAIQLEKGEKPTEFQP